jgi:hypothetical protein
MPLRLAGTGRGVPESSLGVTRRGLAVVALRLGVAGRDLGALE